MLSSRLAAVTRSLARCRLSTSSARWDQKKKGEDGHNERSKDLVSVSGQKETLPEAKEEKSLAERGEEKQQLMKKLFHKPFESTYVTNRPISNPTERTLDQLKPKKYRKTKFWKEGFDAYYDICILGGGVMGCSVAYWLASRIYKSHKICVVEKDPSYSKCSTTLSVGGLRQQFSMPENVEMSLYGADFLRQAHRLLHVEGVDLPPVNFQPHGYLYLATEDGAHILESNYEVQT